MGLVSFILGFGAGFYIRGRKFRIQMIIEPIVFQMLQNKDVTQYKLALVIRDDLNMGRGKIASQCSHASVLAFKTAMLSHQEAVEMWEAFGSAKIVLKTQSELSLLDLKDKAKKIGLLTNIVCDAGRTEVVAGTKTVLAIGPGPVDAIDKITGHLKLL
ncbi:peptidyl-tRNA hydrolase 2, mitochondrial-like isoform X1 [Stegodyphus dumicola]|uniref:peptidyl-tRNA hydrolase 2, mitochondrial-like isoform X1 n=2 Tax=Stegodyphus dumicola TaxID=202533 RepID=UPI0015AA5998|nr:peptidyl-tRNA hydrolase 2, mitochondrial-like isoform X1 [Stegodyphus dumicola]